MKAVIFTKPGPPEVLQLVEVEKPTPSENEVLIKVHTTTVTSGDTILRGLKFPLSLVFNLAFGMGKNKILGHELAGEIESIGDNVKRFQNGDNVFASTGTKGGAYAEYICVPEDGMVALKPPNLSFEEAAAVPIGANTALVILRKGNIHKGQELLVYGASGSVGTYAVQLAKHFGADVTGVCSTANLDMVRSLGAKKVIDYTATEFTQSGETYDVVFDAVGKVSSSYCKNILKENGIFLTVNSPTKEKAEDLVYLKELIEAGKLKPVIDQRYQLEEIVEAHRYVQTGHKKGNVVIIIV